MYSDDDDWSRMNEEEYMRSLLQMKRADKGYNTIYRKAVRQTGKRKGSAYNKKIELYTSGCIGSEIRDAETGEYFTHRVGSKDEDLYYKVILATGECKSANGSYTAFFRSPNHYANHMECSVSTANIAAWEKKRMEREREREKDN
jgi:hypothetical protein